MKDGYIQVYYGQGKGKTTAAIGQGIRSVNLGKKVIMIQFLNDLNYNGTDSIKKLEPEFKVFNFAKKRDEESTFCYVDEQKTEVLTALNFSKKIFDTCECDLLILDEILVAIDKKYIEEDTLYDLLKNKSANMSVILTGRILPNRIAEISDYIYCICVEKEAEI